MGNAWSTYMDSLQVWSARPSYVDPITFFQPLLYQTIFGILSHSLAQHRAQSPIPNNTFFLFVESILYPNHKLTIDSFLLMLTFPAIRTFNYLIYWIVTSRWFLITLPPNHSDLQTLTVSYVMSKFSHWNFHHVLFDNAPDLSSLTCTFSHHVHGHIIILRLTPNLDCQAYNFRRTLGLLQGIPSIFPPS